MHGCVHVCGKKVDRDVIVSSPLIHAHPLTLPSQQRYGQEGQAATRADIGLPLQPIKTLMTSRQMPNASVSVSIKSANSTSATVEVAANMDAAAM